MTYEFTHKGVDNHNLIVIFAGWSTDAHFYSHITIEGWDTLVVSGYSNLEFNEELLEGYVNIALFAWSLGVYAAARCFPFNRACMSVAVNGTEHPVNDSLGIPGKIFTGTSSILNERNLMKFRRRMAGSGYPDIATRFSEIPIAELKAQLDFIHDDYLHNAQRNESHWNRVYIADNDLIFPAGSQKEAWLCHHSKPQVINVNANHYIDLFTIVAAAIPRPEIVGKKFRKALPTYNDFASPQQKIAERLISLLPSDNNENNDNTDNTDNNDNNENTDNNENILEIGPGTGLLTRRFAATVHPKSMDFVDLFDAEPFNVAPIENYFTADAESWIAKAAKASPERYDAVISASAIQWFVNPSQFFKNAAAVLKPGGLLLCSTFLPGNLRELHDVNPYGLVYHSSEEIEKYLSFSFSKVVIINEDITVRFHSPRETLSHLINTGVGGSAKSSLPLGELLSRLPSSLTYRPLYILAIK